MSINNMTNPQLITFTILHDLHLICSFIISYPLYFSYIVYFTPSVIKLVSFVSPLYIITVFLSILITASMINDLNALKLGIVEIVVQVMKWNLDECDCGCEFEEFEIYKIVFDCEFLIMICDQSDELGFEKVLECSVYGDRIDDVVDYDSDLERLGVENIPEISAYGCRKSDVASCGADVDKIRSVHGGQKSDVATCKFYVDEFSSVYGGQENDVEICDADVDKIGSVLCCRKSDVATCKSDEDKISSGYGGRKNDVAICNSEMNKLGIEELIEVLDKFEDFTAVKKVSNGSETRNSINDEKLSEKFVISSTCTSISNSPSIVSSYGSMREDNEWRKTLACKLFEERHNSLGGEEGMDSLWETHETNNSKNRNKNNTKSISFNTDINIDTDTDTDEMVMSNGHLCCLQALKFSIGKMNLGMGKPNIVKITKAFKGFRLLNYVKKKHGNKT